MTNDIRRPHRPAAAFVLLSLLFVVGLPERVFDGQSKRRRWLGASATGETYLAAIRSEHGLPPLAPDAKAREGGRAAGRLHGAVGRDEPPHRLAQGFRHSHEGERRRRRGGRERRARQDGTRKAVQDVDGLARVTAATCSTRVLRITGWRPPRTARAGSTGRWCSEDRAFSSLPSAGPSPLVIPGSAARPRNDEDMLGRFRIS